MFPSLHDEPLCEALESSTVSGLDSASTSGRLLGCDQAESLYLDVDMCPSSRFVVVFDDMLGSNFPLSLASKALVIVPPSRSLVRGFPPPTLSQPLAVGMSLIVSPSFELAIGQVVVPIETFLQCFVGFPSVDKGSNRSIVVISRIGRQPLPFGQLVALR